MDGDKANKIVMANIDIPRANEEVPWAIPKGCIWFTLQVRDGTAVRVAVESGKVASSQPPYFTLKADNSWDERTFGIDPRHGFPLFLACSTASKVVEVMLGIYDPEVGGEL